MRKYSKDWTSKMKDKHGRYIGMFTYGEGSDFAFRKTYDHYRPLMKWGHTHNHIYNKCHKHIFRSKQARKNVDRKDKPEFVRIMYMNLALGNYSFDKILHTIFHHNKNYRHVAQKVSALQVNGRKESIGDKSPKSSEGRGFKSRRGTKH